MAESGRRYNPKEKKPIKTGKQKMDKILNLLIGVVVVLILIVAGFIVIGGSNNKDSATKDNKTVQQDTKNIVEKDSKELEKEKAKKAEQAQKESEKQNQPTESSTQENQSSTNTSETATDNNSSNSETISDTNTVNNYGNSNTATVESSNDPNVKKVIVDSNWKPTKTTQKDDGNHNSNYDQNSVDWKEKITTIATTTGLDEKDMIVWYVKNGGSPDTAIGIVSSKDKKNKYRVSLKWVSNEGWQPTKLEVLNSIKGSY